MGVWGWISLERMRGFCLWLFSGFGVKFLLVIWALARFLWFSLCGDLGLDFEESDVSDQ